MQPNQDQLIKILDEKYSHLPIEERQQLYEMYFNPETQEELKSKLEAIIFYKKPPTIEEFLDPAYEWLPATIIASTFEHVKSELKEIIDPNKHISKIVEYGATRLGKTYMARLLILYTIVFIHYIREPAMYYGLSPITRLCIYFVSFKFDKTRQLYLEPMYEIMRQSKRFKQVKFEDKVRSTQQQVGRDIVVWSKAATSGEITLASGLQLQMGNNDALSVIGADMLQCYISEIGFFIENAGATEEQIFRLYTDISTRIYNTVKNNYLAWVYLDTSANNADSMIEKHIINDLQFEENVHFKWQAQWDARRDLFPVWDKTGETFKVITGNGSIPAKIVDSPTDLVGIPSDLVIDVPIDALKLFKMNLLKQIKDIAGRPTAAENKFINDISIIDNIFSNPLIKNIEGSLVADSVDLPEGLLWNQIKDKFFYKKANNGYEILRAPKEPRFVGIDLSFALHGDVTGLTILHKEFDVEKKEVVYVVDLSCAITAREKSINIEAVPKLLVDLLTFASVPIKYVFADTFHSEGSKQTLERAKVEFMKQSVDKDVTAYQTLSTIMNNGLVKAGKNIFLKNNLNCLLITREEGKGKEKIDHPKGRLTNTYLGDWENSKCGTFAKDVSDSLAQAVYGAYSTLYIPSTVYQEENKKFSNKSEDTQERIQRAYNQLHKFY